MKQYIIFFAFILISQTIFSQRVRGTISVGQSAYMGDLQQKSIFLEQSSPSLIVGLSYDINNYFRIRGDLGVMGAKGDDKLSTKTYTKQRNLNFQTTIYEAALLGEFDYLNWVLKKDLPVTPYIIWGSGVFRFNPTTIDRNGNKVYLHSIGTEGQALGNPLYDYRRYSLIQLNFQFGGGIKFKISEKLNLGVEVSLRKLFTDYLDDVHSKNYVDPSEFLAKGQTLAAQLSFRGDELGYTFADLKNSGRGSNKGEDFYYTCQFKISYRLDNIRIGSDNYYFFSNKKALRSQRNPPNL
jgi:opacity protein-like surface antigen